MQWTVIESGTGDVQALPAHPMLVLKGVSYSETASSASTAEIVLYHGTSTADKKILPPINFAADGYGYPHDFTEPLYVPNGVFLERVSGETTVLLYWDYDADVRE